MSLDSSGLELGIVSSRETGTDFQMKALNGTAELSNPAFCANPKCQASTSPQAHILP
jgi:hypothetical protein